MPEPLTFIQFEYDPEYYGGDYDGVGTMVLVPKSLCESVGHTKAFEQFTGKDQVHVVSYNPDEVYDAQGESVEDDGIECIFCNKCQKLCLASGHDCEANGEVCDECGNFIPNTCSSAMNKYHKDSCSLYELNVV